MIYGGKSLFILDESVKELVKSASNSLTSEISHMLKIMYQTEKWKSNSWNGTINNELEKVFEKCKNTNVSKGVNENLDTIYSKAREKAALETKLDISTFPEERDKTIFNLDNLTSKEYIESFYKKYEEKKNGRLQQNKKR